jgi:hypothetical protein
MDIINNGLDLLNLWVGITASYVLAAAMIVVGIYLVLFLGTNPLNPFSSLVRFLGLCLIVVGVALGTLNLGKSIGASACEAAWNAKDLDAQIERLQQEAAAKKIASETVERSLQNIASQKDDLQKKVSEYQEAARRFAACRHATANDDRRMCDILGAGAPGCQHPK